ncbi:PhzF family phenazine biosynthesis protein [soil metagenome]
MALRASGATQVSLEYEVVDVFTGTPFAGNPLAVVLGAGDLEQVQLQHIANEFNLSETAFPMAAQDGADYRLRIFTPVVELPFAGHPSVGAAWVLARRGLLAPGSVVQSCGAGRLALDVGADGGPVTLTGGTTTVGPAQHPERFLRAVGLSHKDLIGVEPRACGTGLEFAFLLVRAGAVARCVPDLAALRALGGAGVSVFAWDGELAHARVFAGGVGVAEDPATGSAALGLGVYLVATGLLEDGGAYVVHQGVEMGRPSRLDCAVAASGGAATSVTVTGEVVPIAAGRIRVPLPR